MATDLGLRAGDLIAIKKDDLPQLDQETPIPFDIMTEKEEVIAYLFLSFRQRSCIIEEEGFAEAQHGAISRRKRCNSQTATIALGNFHLFPY